MKLITESGEQILLPVEKNQPKKEWDYAHDYLNKLESTEKAPVFVEPDKKFNLYEESVPVSQLTMKGSRYLERWPAPESTEIDRIVWHLNEKHSQLKKASETLLQKDPLSTIKIAIIDTGVQKEHPFLPQKLHPGISFIEGEEGKPAYDKLAGTSLEQEGHGTATACLLAGTTATIHTADDQYTGVIGAIPFAEIIPVRISETVALIRNKAFVDAVEYAIEQGCEVISMSMAGAPTKAWANVVNKAYEKGIVLVTAAGNSWYEGVKRVLPKRVLYPARWERVIAATGIACDGLPYNMDARMRLKSEGGEDMQGNYGPPEAMTSALSAYTPNVIWSTTNDKKSYRLDGGGTSSATPQIAAAAAIWLSYHRDEINGIVNNDPDKKWMKVEMVKKALFQSADKSYAEYKKYFGNGALKTYDALQIRPQKPKETDKATAATVLLWGILDLLALLLRLKGKPEVDKIRQEMFATEILQELHENEALFDLLDSGDTTTWNNDQKLRAKKELLESDRISEALKEHIRKSEDQ